MSAFVNIRKHARFLPRKSLMINAGFESSNGPEKVYAANCQRGATIRKIWIVQTEGERNVERSPLFYNLDAIIAEG